MSRLAALAAALALVAVSCGDDNPTGGPGGLLSDTAIYEVQTDYGPMLCVVWNGYQKGGISCTALGWEPSEVTP